MRGKVKAKMHIYMPNVRKVNFKKNGKAIKGLIVIDSDVRCQGQIFHIFSNRVLQLSPVSHTSLQKIQQFYVFNNFQDSIELRDRGRCEYPFYCVRNFNGHSSCFHCISSFF